MKINQVVNDFERFNRFRVKSS